MQIIAHGLSTPALFLLAGSIQERCHTRELTRLGGLWQTAPRLSGFVIFFALTALGLPGLVNFVGEFLILLAAYQSHLILAIMGSLGFVFSVIYALRLVQESVYGPNLNKWSISDLTIRETASLGVLVAIVLTLGLWPRPIFIMARASLSPVKQALSNRAKVVSPLDRDEQGGKLP